MSLEITNFHDKVLEWNDRRADTLKADYGKLMESIKTDFETNKNSVLTKAKEVAATFSGKSTQEIVTETKKSSALNYSLQIILQNLGFGGTKFIDWLYGPKMESAVRKFQKSVWISIDGVVGSITLGKLLESVNTVGKEQAKETEKEPVNKPQKPTIDSLPEYAKKIPEKQLSTMIVAIKKYINPNITSPQYKISNTGTKFTFKEYTDESNAITLDLVKYRNEKMQTWDEYRMVVDAKRKIDSVKEKNNKQKEYYKKIEDQEGVIEETPYTFEKLWLDKDKYENPVVKSWYKTFFDWLYNKTIKITVKDFNNDKNQLEWKWVGNITWATPYKDIFAPESWKFLPEKFKDVVKYAVKKYVENPKNWLV